MYHSIEFRLPVLADVDIPGQGRLEQLVIKKGSVLSAQVRPYVVESEEGPVEMADLLTKDGSVARAVRFASFRFLDERNGRKE